MADPTDSKYGFSWGAATQESPCGGGQGDYSHVRILPAALIILFQVKKQASQEFDG
jgi:hypothetical protein